jgi:hypothetical protein
MQLDFRAGILNLPDVYEDETLVAPQGFTRIENKGDAPVFHNVPHVVPHNAKQEFVFRFVTHFLATLELPSEKRVSR